MTQISSLRIHAVCLWLNSSYTETRTPSWYPSPDLSSVHSTAAVVFDSSATKRNLFSVLKGTQVTRNCKQSLPVQFSPILSKMNVDKPLKTWCSRVENTADVGRGLSNSWALPFWSSSHLHVQDSWWVSSGKSSLPYVPWQTSWRFHDTLTSLI